MADPDQLERFVTAQDRGGTYEGALAELRAGRKRGHWMWFVFPQIAGLGRSPTAQAYAIASLDEARAYLDPPVLGPGWSIAPGRSRSCSGSSAEEILGGVDAMKLRSSMTLFARAAPENPLFAQVLEKYYEGVADQATDRLLESASGS